VAVVVNAKHQVAPFCPWPSKALQPLAQPQARCPSKVVRVCVCVGQREAAREEHIYTLLLALTHSHSLTLTHSLSCKGGIPQVLPDGVPEALRDTPVGHWLLETAHTTFHQALATDVLEAPERQPFVNRYAARAQIMALLARLDALAMDLAEPLAIRGSTHHPPARNFGYATHCKHTHTHTHTTDAHILKSLLLYHRGVNHTETEETSEGERCLTKVRAGMRGAGVQGDWENRIAVLSLASSSTGTRGSAGALWKDSGEHPVHLLRKSARDHLGREERVQQGFPVPPGCGPCLQRCLQEQSRHSPAHNGRVRESFGYCE
jgi:hypothetical protein